MHLYATEKKVNAYTLSNFHFIVFTKLYCIHLEWKIAQAWNWIQDISRNLADSLPTELPKQPLGNNIWSDSDDRPNTQQSKGCLSELYPTEVAQREGHSHGRERSYVRSMAWILFTNYGNFQFVRFKMVSLSVLLKNIFFLVLYYRYFYYWKH